MWEELFIDDYSSMKHISNNGNIWLTCNCPKNNEVVNVKIGLN